MKKKDRDTRIDKDNTIDTKSKMTQLEDKYLSLNSEALLQ